MRAISLTGVPVALEPVIETPEENWSRYASAASMRAQLESRHAAIVARNAEKRAEREAARHVVTNASQAASVAPCELFVPMPSPDWRCVSCGYTRNRHTLEATLRYTNNDHYLRAWFRAVNGED
jgi:hypothetical protein